MTDFISIDGQRVGPAYPPYVIAELSANHNGDLQLALQTIDAACSSGASAIKIQSYSPDTITLDCDSEDFMIRGGLWDGYSLYRLYEEAQTPFDWHGELFDHARKRGITMFSSPFDHSAVDLLEDLGAPAYKVASFEANDIPLIRYVASTGKPIILSTGMAGIDEIQEAVDTAREAGCSELALLHCVSGYPSPADQYNVRTVADLADRFDVVSGLSDHSLGNATALAAIACGASIVEKHFTLSRAQGGHDASFSCEPGELQDLCRDAATVWEALGEVTYLPQKAESGNIKYRRSLYTVRDVAAGEALNPSNVRSIRPGYGLAPRHYDEILGRRAARAIVRGTPLAWELLE